MKSPSKKVVWQCINYIEKDANTGKRCGAKAEEDEVLKAAFVRVYNGEFKDKANFYKAFLANVEKVIEKNNILNVTRGEVKDSIGYLKSKNLKLISISAHDSCDWALDEFKNECKGIYQKLKVGVPIIVNA